MSNERGIGGTIALITGIVLVVGGGIIALVLTIRKNKENEDDQAMNITSHQQSNGDASINKGAASFSAKQVKAMQTYLLQLGVKHNNQYIIDAIQLTGGIDGKIGSGFHAAIKEAQEQGYLEGYEDILRRLGY